MRKILIVWLQAVIAMCLSFASSADLLDDIGYTALSDLLGAALPTGELATIDQTEASNAPEGELEVYLANGALSAFPNTQIIDQSGINPDEFSSHANSVAQRIGGTASQLPNLMQIDAYEAVDWMETVLRRDSPFKPLGGSGEIANHSWRGAYGDVPSNVDVLQRLDWLIVEDDYFQAIGMGSISTSIIFAHAMNGVGVKNTASTTSMATTPLDDIYTANRPAVHVVAPDSSSSNATGVVSSTAMLLKQIFSSIELPPVLLKAALMAGAERETNNSQDSDIQDYGAVPSQNGLDYRYGAGQLNVLNSYQILTGANQAAGSEINDQGYDFVEDFGLSGQTNIYPFNTSSQGAELFVSLVWNLNLNLQGGPFNPDPILYDLNLELFDVTGGAETLLASSASSIDNSENLWLPLGAGRQYELRVSHLHPQSFNWPYAIAWRIIRTEDPLSRQIPLFPFPAAIAFFGLLCWLRFRHAHE